jgi:hypothetical protein
MRISTLIAFTLLVTIACSSRTNIGTAGSQAQALQHSVQVSFLESSASTTFTKADFDQHILQLKPRLPSKDFSIVVQPPFVVIGDEPHNVLKERAGETIKWAVEKLKQDFFPNDPSEILDIWLFKNELSYQKHTSLLFNDKPSTPYGYYSRAHKALIMNIATGGGTLVHELVHPFMEANFPACPSWLNEGMGSLYEQCAERDGHIYGFVNWRLPGLQEAVKAGNVPSFKELTSLDTSQFYSDNRGVNYAQARYLCYYLQEKGLLVKFYRRFHANHRNDPTGYKTLTAVLGNPNMDRFKKNWEKYVLELTEDFRLQPAN